MIGIFRAFAWLRWRLLMNSLERTGARDTLERFSLAIEQLGPIIALILLVPTALALAVVGVLAGLALARGDVSTVPVVMTRYMLLVAPLLVLIGPFILPAADRTNPVRLLLLPIPRSALYIAQSSSALGDPWNLLAVPLILALPIGLLAGSALGAGLLTTAAALLVIAVLVGLSSLAASLLHLMVRDRRRGELIALIFIVILPAISMLPAMLGSSSRRARMEQPVARERTINPWIDRASRAALAVVPTEVYITGARAAAAGHYARSAASVATLGAMAALLHAIGFVAFRLVLESPASSGARRGVPMRDVWTRRLPGLSQAASAVALAQLRLAIRTPRGRAIMLSPLMVFVIFGAMMYRNAGTMNLRPFAFSSGIALSTFTSFLAVLSILPIAANQFAVDRAGLTMALLSPLRDQEILAGKAVGNALVVAPAAILCILAGFAIFPGGSLALWITLPIGLVGAYVLTSPIAAICSAVFPRVADLNSIGRGGNPHGLANLLGMLSFVAGGVIPLLLTLLSTKLLKQPTLAPLFATAWCVVAYVIARALFIPARRIFNQRRENLAMLE